MCKLGSLLIKTLIKVKAVEKKRAFSKTGMLAFHIKSR